MIEEFTFSERKREVVGRIAEWQPIETAPKDGTRVLLFTTHEADDYYDETFSEIQIGRWDGGNVSDDPMWSREADWDLEKIGEPTHWQPLPAPPSRVQAVE